MARASVRAALRSGVLTERGLTAGQGVVLLALVDHADADGFAYPAQETLAIETGMSRMGVRKALAGLQEKGIVELVDPGGPRRSAKYRVAI